MPMHNDADGPSLLFFPERLREGVLRPNDCAPLVLASLMAQADSQASQGWLIVEGSPEDLDLPTLRSQGFRLVALGRDGHTLRLRRRIRVSGHTVPHPPQSRRDLAGRTLCIIPYSHCDWAWTDSRAWHAARYAALHARAVTLLETLPEFRWCIDNFNELMEPVRELRPEILPDMRRFVAEGRLDILGGALALVHSHRVGGETFIRNMQIGQKRFLELFPEARFPVFALMDTIVGSTQMPQLLRLLEFELLRVCRPSEFLVARGIPREFRWKGLDGTEMLCSVGHYGGWHDFSLDGWEEDWDRVAEAAFRKEIKEWSDHSLSKTAWLPMGSDDIFPLAQGWRESTQDVPLPAFIHAWQDREASVLRFATPSEYAELLKKEAGQLPIIEGPLDIAGWTMWYGHIGVDSLATLRFQVEGDLLETEGIRSLLASKASEDLEDIWEAMIRSSAHAMLWLFEEDYEERLAVMRKAVLDAREKRISAQREFAFMRPCRAQDLLLYNGLPYPRTELVFLRKVFAKNEKNRAIQVEDARGTPIPSQISEPLWYEEGRLREAVVAIQAEVPAMGSVAVRLKGVDRKISEPGQATWDGSLFDHERWRIQFGSQGMDSIQDKHLGLEVLGPGRVTYFHTDQWREPYFSSDPVAILTWRETSVRLMDQGRLFARWLIEGRVGDHAARQIVTLDLESGLVQMDTTLYVGYQANGEFRLSFVLPESLSRLHGDVLFGVEKRDVDEELYAPVGYGPVGCERMDDNVFYASTWVDASDGQKGAAVFLEPGLQGFQHEPRDNTLYATLLKAIRHPDQPWESLMTRKREGAGVQAFKSGLWLHAGGWQKADLVRRAQRLWRPVRALPQTGGAPFGLAPGSLLSFGDDRIVLSSLCPCDSGAVLRIFNASEDEVHSTALWKAWPLAEVEKVTLQGHPMEQVRWEKETIQIQLRAWEIATYTLMK